MANLNDEIIYHPPQWWPVNAVTKGPQNLISCYFKELMDTDDLSEEAYDAVIVTAERFHHDLTLQFGVLAGECDNEDEYLNECLKLIRGLKRLRRDTLSDVFFDNEPDITELKKVLDQIKEGIDRVKSIDVKKRKFERW